ncbi:hypothetical protein [Humibacter sp.]|uniref:hypothetical protein n=1 Tax=Humibacter sp. TaxID=1940291 RepID=UPI003F80A218
MAETTTKMRIPAKWTDDCQGKKDFDGTLVSISTRYWPRGGGFSMMYRDERGVTQFGTNTNRDIKPSANASIHLDYFDADGDPEYQALAMEEFEAETEDEVKAQVEAWAATQYARVVAAMRREFLPEVPNG